MSKDKSDDDNLERRVAELETQVHNLEKDLIHDPLTGLKTRPFFEEEVSIHLQAIIHNKQDKRKEWFGFRNIGIIFFDIDNFKNINDTYGHEVGDHVLEKVADIIKTSLRTGDTSARWGGEEIVVSLLGASMEDALIKADKIRKEISNLTFPEAPDLLLTISAGVTSTKYGQTVTELIKQADKALYQAKALGRNKVAAYE